MLCPWEGSSIGDIEAAFTYLVGRHNGVITSIVLEVVHFELAVSFDPRHKPASSVERDVNIL